MAKDKGKKKEHSNAEKPISLKPLEFDEAVSDILKVKPRPKEEKKQKEENKGNGFTNGYRNKRSNKE